MPNQNSMIPVQKQSSSTTHAFQLLTNATNKIYNSKLSVGKNHLSLSNASNNLKTLADGAISNSKIVTLATLLSVGVKAGKLTEEDYVAMTIAGYATLGIVGTLALLAAITCFFKNTNCVETCCEPSDTENNTAQLNIQEQAFSEQKESDRLVTPQPNKQSSVMQFFSNLLPGSQNKVIAEPVAEIMQFNS